MAEVVEILINAKDQFSGAFGKLTSVLPSVKTLAISAGAGVAGLGTSLIAMAKTTATAYDQVGKFSDRIGISTEALSKYRYIADLSGVSSEKLQLGFQRMTRRIAEAGQGTGVAQNALKELGISIDSITGRAPDKQFEIIAGKLGEVASQSDKVRLAMQFFDSEGVALLQTLKGGTEGLESMKKEAEKFGLVISERAANNAAAFNDSLTRVTGSLRGVKNTIAEQLLPTFTGLSNKFADFIADNREGIVDFAEKFLSGMGNLVEYGAYGAATLSESWRGLQLVWQGLKVGFAEFSLAINEGITFIVEKFTWLLEKVNFRGIFDNDIALLNSVKTNTQDAINELFSMKTTALNALTEIAGEESSFAKVEELKERIKTAMAEIQAAGTPEGGEGEGPTGIGIMSDANIEKTRENMAALQEMWNEYVLTDLERLDLWYSEQQAKYKGNLEAQEKLSTIYNARLSKLQQKKTKDSTKTEYDLQKELYSIGSMFGKKGVMLAKAAALPKAFMSMYAGAAKALELPFPSNIAAAASVVATGLGYIQGITGQSFGGAAHGGLTSVPAEATYLLNKDERVLSPGQNRDLIDFMSAGGGGMNINVESLVVATPKPIEEMKRDDWIFLAETELIPALSWLSKRGIKIRNY